MSFWTATGRTRSSTNARTVSWIRRSSSVRLKSIGRSVSGLHRHNARGSGAGWGVCGYHSVRLHARLLRSGGDGGDGSPGGNGRAGGNNCSGEIGRGGDGGRGRTGAGGGGAGGPSIGVLKASGSTATLDGATTVTVGAGGTGGAGGRSGSSDRVAPGGSMGRSGQVVSL